MYHIRMTKFLKGKQIMAGEKMRWKSHREYPT